MKYAIFALFCAFFIAAAAPVANADGCCDNKHQLEVCPPGPDGPEGPIGERGPKGDDGHCAPLNVQCPAGFFIASINGGMPDCAPITGHPFCDVGGGDTTETQTVQCAAGQTVFEREYNCANQAWSPWQITQNDCH